MEKMMVLRSICRAAAAASLRSSRFTAHNHQLRHHLVGSRNFFSLSSPSLAASPKRLPSEDPEVQNVFKDLMATNWDELPHVVIHDAKKALAKNTDDKAGQEAMANVFRAAEAVEEFGGILTSMKMEIDDSIGLSGEPLPNELSNALSTVYQRYSTYLDALGPDETYLRKKVETEFGTKMIHLKMRCSSLGSKWGKVTVLGTSGLCGSYVEQRA